MVTAFESGIPLAAVSAARSGGAAVPEIKRLTPLLLPVRIPIHVGVMFKYAQAGYGIEVYYLAGVLHPWRLYRPAPRGAG
jgi:hypothetical protein